ncbi:ribonuclease P protein component [Salinisphaera aquimarina]|uniref:Ribonuclease P protein component n=1 Tax=Salinisphaera aquimarina TaxID=2094031 RepID=A0ABV7EQA5_9GAMM
MSQAAFPKTARLRKSGEFKAVFAGGHKFVCAGFVLIAAPAGTPRARLGLALAKRRIARSVDRNRIKRVLRESFRNHRSVLAAVDIVVLARSRTGAMSNADLFAQLAGIWPQIARLDSLPRPDRLPPGGRGQR